VWRKSLSATLSLILPLFFSPLLMGCWTGHLHGYKNSDGEIDLTSLSIEELMEIEFVRLFKKPGRLFESAAAAYAISDDDIGRIGVNSLPEALRTVPGIQVSQHNASSYAVTIRGFSGLSRGIGGQFANKLLVMSDGRTIYTPLFSGVSWETQDVMLEDIERIEVIRGPGASIWGANAVNGIINIISKSSEDTQGTLLSVGGGTEFRSFGHLRYGGSLGDDTFFRIYGKYLKADGFVDSSGTDTPDDWHILRGGFRVDTYPSTDNLLTLQGEIYSGNFGQTYNIVRTVEPPFWSTFNFDNKNSGGSVLGRWRHKISSDSEFSLQVFFDRVRLKEATVNGRIHTYDLDFYHRLPLGRRHDIVWGAGYRLVSDRFDSTFTFSLNPATRKIDILNAFVQDDIRLLDKQLILTVGSKFEHNEFTGFEVQPNIRLFWSPAENHAVWTSVSRAIRSPSRGERDARIVLQASGTRVPTTFIVLNGNDGFESESVLAFETGYRVRMANRLTSDIAVFFNDYDNLRSDDLIPPAIASVHPPHTEFPVFVNNNLTGRAYGLEVTGDYQASKNFKLKATYNYLKLDLSHKLIPGRDLVNEGIEDQSPQHQFYLETFYQLHPKLNANVFLRFVDELPGQGVSSYLSLDCHVRWRLSEAFSVSLTGQNLLTNHHAEDSQILNSSAVFFTTGTKATRVQRGVYTKFSLTF